jgi:thiosulfate reductase cytochrome b subunit
MNTRGRVRARVAIRDSDTPDRPRHSAPVRVTHWITVVSFFALLVSGFAILLAHPRLYWGETGAVGTPSLIDLPLPFVLTGQSGWGRYLHFLAAWASVFTGIVYVLYGVRTRHFGRGLRRIYNPPQRLTYVIVVFALFPLIIWSGLAMSPAITSVFPGAVSVLGGQQSARTIHFFVANALVLFVLVHIGMVSRAGFTSRVRMMTTGWTPAGTEQG